MDFLSLRLKDYPRFVLVWLAMQGLGMMKESDPFAVDGVKFPDAPWVILIERIIGPANCAGGKNACQNIDQ